MLLFQRTLRQALDEEQHKVKHKFPKLANFCTFFLPFSKKSLKTPTLPLLTDIKKERAPFCNDTRPCNILFLANAIRQLAIY